MIQQALIFDFSMGELSPKLRGRFDNPIYQHGASLLKNATPHPQGGFSIRDGSEYLGRTKSDAAARLIPFIINPTTAYILELGRITGQPTGYLRIWHEGALLENAGVPLELSSPYTAAEIPEIHYTQDNARLIFTHKNRPVYVFGLTAGPTFTFDVISITGNAGEVPFQSATNYPGACQFHEGRLWLAATQTQPGGVWASKPFEYDNFTFYETVETTVQILKDPETWADPYTPEYEAKTITRKVITSASAVSFEVDDTIQWLASGRDLIVGTVRGERIVPAGSFPPIIACQRNTAIGTAGIQPFMLAGAVIMVEADRHAVREYQYQEQQNAYHAPALTFASDHILQSGVKYLEYQNNPTQAILALRDDGTLACCVYEKAQGVTAWYRHVTAGVIESIAVIPDSEADTIYMIVNRSGRRTVERIKAGVRLDSSAIRAASGGKITDLTWLDGPAAILYNGNLVSVTVTAGEALLPAGILDGAVIRVGLPYTMEVASMPLPGQSRIGTAHMRPKNPAQVIARVLNCHPFKTGTIVTQLEAANIQGPYTGDVKIPIRAQWDTEGVVHFIQDAALDTTILAIQVELDAGG